MTTETRPRLSGLIATQLTALYSLAHLLAAASLVAFGLLASGYPLNRWSIYGYAGAALVALILSLRALRHRNDRPNALLLTLLPLLAACTTLAPTPSPPVTQLPIAPPSDCPHIPLGGFYDVWRNEQVWPRLGCAAEAAIPINGTEAYLCCPLHSIWIQEKRLFVALDESSFRWAFVADGSGLPAEAVLVTPTWQPPTATPGPPPPTPEPTPPQVSPPTPLTATSTPLPSPTQLTVTPPAGATTPLPTVVLMTQFSWPSSERGVCFRASGRHGWLANLPPWAEKCRGLSASNETLFSGAMEQFEGGWLLWNGNVCFVLFADGRWTMF